MGYFLSKLWKRLTGKGEREYKILIVGLHNAGNTTILYKLALNEVVVTQPTIGSNVEEVTHENVRLQVWDLGGQENLRQAWDAQPELRGLGGCVGEACEAPAGRGDAGRREAAGRARAWPRAARRRGHALPLQLALPPRRPLPKAV